MHVVFLSMKDFVKLTILLEKKKVELKKNLYDVRATNSFFLYCEKDFIIESYY